MGIVYRSEADTDLEGDVKFEGLRNPQLLAALPRDVKISWTNPQWLEAGLRYRMDDDTQLYFNVVTTSDTSEADARQRAAAQHGTARLAAALGSGRGRSLEFDEWASHGASVEVTVGPYIGDALDAPPPGQAYRGVVVSREAVGLDGWRAPLSPASIVCTLIPAEPTSAGWLDTSRLPDH